MVASCGVLQHEVCSGLAQQYMGCAGMEVTCPRGRRLCLLQMVPQLSIHMGKVKYRISQAVASVALRDLLLLL